MLAAGSDAPDNGLGPTDLADNDTPARVLGTKTVRPSRTVANLPMTGTNIGVIAAVGAGLLGAGAAMTARRAATDGADVEDVDSTE